MHSCGKLREREWGEFNLNIWLFSYLVTIREQFLNKNTSSEYRDVNKS